MIKRIRKNIPVPIKGIIKYLIKCCQKSHLKSLLVYSTSNKKIGNRIQKIYREFYPISILEDLQRFGGKSDGGYLIPDTSNIRYSGLISPGVGDSLSFESDFQAAVSKVILIDGSVNEPANLPLNYVFYQKFLQSDSSKNIQGVTLKEVLDSEFVNQKNLVLQMDIEGNEYEVLEEITTDNLLRFSLILIEFHFIEKILKHEGFSEIKLILDKLKKNFYLVHTHPNNAGGYFLYRFKKYPRVLETTWVIKQAVTPIDKVKKLPHSLDQINDKLSMNLHYPRF